MSHAKLSITAWVVGRRATCDSGVKSGEVRTVEMADEVGGAKAEKRVTW